MFTWRKKTCIFFCTLCPLMPGGGGARIGHITSCLYETLQNLLNLYDRKTFYIYNIVFIYLSSHHMFKWRENVNCTLDFIYFSFKSLLDQIKGYTTYYGIHPKNPKIRQATRQADFPFRLRLWPKLSLVGCFGFPGQDISWLPGESRLSRQPVLQELTSPCA